MIRLLKRFFRKRSTVTESDQLREIFASYPDFRKYIEHRFRISITSNELKRRFASFCESRKLPPAQILYMEWQLHQQLDGIRVISPLDAKSALSARTNLQILDVRDDWERKMGSLPQAIPVDDNRPITALVGEDRSRPILLYCHFGVKSLDAAMVLKRAGFTDLSVIEGGIDAWSAQVDPSIPRYTEAWC